jgi:predicted nuclease of predicted toxin-antitoxin system
VRFVLDNDVDARVARVLRQARHECWTAAAAGLAGPVSADDDEVAVYAHNKGAVLITHDREFTRRRMKNTIGQHVRLDCEQPDAPDVIAEQLNAIIEALEGLENVVLIVSASRVRIHHGRWE